MLIKIDLHVHTKDRYITAHLLAEYNRIAFVRLLTLLDKEWIENNIHNMLIGL